MKETFTYSLSYKEKVKIFILNSLFSIKQIPVDYDKALIITDKYCNRNYKEYLTHIKNILGCNVFVKLLSKDVKSFKNYYQTLLFMFANNFSRRSLIIAFGGGSVSDIAGFLSSTYMRGIKFIVFPTTFLAQIDAALGGKNAIDINNYKNMVGTFKNPDMIFCCFDFLNSVDIIRSSGELIKYFFINPSAYPKDKAKFYESVKRLDKKDIFKAIMASINIKMKIVKNDLFDSNGEREILNLGHTAAHAIEYASGKVIMHGEAVLWGMKYIYILSQFFTVFSSSFKSEAEKLLNLEKNVPSIEGISFEDFYKALVKDKKNRGKKNKFLLFDKTGRIIVKENISKKKLEEAFTLLKQWNLKYTN